MAYIYNKETPLSIFNWAQSTFKKPSFAEVSARTLTEITEFIVAVINDDVTTSKEEVADVAIMLWQLAVYAAVDARPAINPETLLLNFDLKAAAVDLGCYYSKYLRRLYGDKERRLRDASRLLARSLICLEYSAYFLKVDLSIAVDEKMAVNRQRKWEKIAKGNYQHIA